MKKYIAFLLCLIMLISLVSCDTANKNKDTGNDTANTETSDKGDGTTDTPTNDINKKYYKIEKLELTKVRYYIYDSNGNIVLSNETDRPLDISMIGDNLVDICIGMGTGISIHKYYDIENNRFSEEYSYVVASSGNLVAYIDTSMEKPMFNRVLVVRDIFDKNIFYKSFGLDFSPTVDYPIVSATFTDGESELEVVYLSERPPVPLSITLPIRRASNEGEILSQSEIAMKMYETALNCDIKVYDTDLREFIYLKDCKKPYEQIPLDEIGSLSYAYTDMDSDLVNELVINCGDTLILRYYEGTVYLYSFIFRNLYYLNTDGSYSWNHNGQNFEYGESQLAFDGAELNTVRLWRIVNDGEPAAEYYIGDKKVTQEELLKYFEDNPNTPIEYTPFEAPWQKAISLERALEIASEYWYECYNIKTGDVDSETGFPYAFLPKNSNNENYRIALAWLVEGSHYSTLEIIEIDAFTGEIIVPTYEPDGKG